MKYVIDIPQGLKIDFENESWTALSCMEMKDALMNGEPLDGVLGEIRAEVAEYGSIWATYAITDETKTDKGIEKLVSGVLEQAKKEVLEIIDKYREEQE